jgi:ferritin-like metal-binding protein YciE
MAETGPARPTSRGDPRFEGRGLGPRFISREDARSMTTPRENLTNWLRDAYAMEGQAIELLETQIKRLENYPEALPRLRRHLDETREQRSQVEQCLHRLGTDTSTVKDTAMKIGATMQGMMHSMAGDEVLKHALGSNAFEHFEAGCYESLMVAAETAGEPDIARTCQRIMEQELDMAAWVWEQLPGLTQKYMQRAETGAAEAKR